jgi:hypothetical protein
MIHDASSTRAAVRALAVVALAVRTSAVRALAVLVLAVPVACAPVRPPPPALAQRPPPPAEDGSSDWHGLVPAPFGTEFAALHAGLHEVLLFREAAAGAAAAGSPDGLDGDECYRSNAAGPRFVGQVTTDYLWCFLHDHLDRIAAVVRLPSADAPDSFARHCARWLEHAAETQRTAVRCAGRDGTLAFSARLLDGPDGAAELAIVVYAAEEH